MSLQNHQDSSCKYRVMVVEDSQVIYQVIKSQVEKLGLGVDYAENGFEAVRLFQSGKHAVILMDCQMPIMDGYEATGIIRSLEEKAGGHIPIIAMTAASSADSIDNCILAGMDDYMTKPFSLESLARMLIKWVPCLKSVIDIAEASEENSPQKTPTSVIDLEQLRSYVGDDEEVKQYVISDYLKHSHERIEAVRRAITARDSGEIRRITHAFKAVNAFVGAAAMVAILKEMEQGAIEEQYAEEEQLFVELVKNHDLVCQALSELKT
ncbi:MAG: response regulator [Syntrophomonadaceae bacterium]|nr:response regulator [Syntrophomonadaceae bacterium]